MAQQQEEEEVEWDESKLLSNIANGIFLISFPMFVILYWIIPAPYGKFLDQPKPQRQQQPQHYWWWYGPKFPASWAWFIFESPNLIWAAVGWYYRKPEPFLSNVNYLLFSFFTIHYIQRALYYPYVMSQTKESNKPVPLLILLCALVFCSFNGYLQCRTLLYYQEFPENWIRHWQFWTGLGLAVMGASLNIYSDAQLRQLKRQQQLLLQKDSDNNKKKHDYYQIPRGGWFEYCSTPHYLGEIVEWMGFSLACQGSWASVSFAVYVAANLIPRGVAQHAWYRNHFGETYPSQRTAIVPFLF